MEKLSHLRQRVAPFSVLFRRAAVGRHDESVVAHMRLGGGEEHAVVRREADDDDRLHITALQKRVERRLVESRKVRLEHEST